MAMADRIRTTDRCNEIKLDRSQWPGCAIGAGEAAREAACAQDADSMLNIAMSGAAVGTLSGYNTLHVWQEA
jgi:hypothetical protein